MNDDALQFNIRVLQGSGGLWELRETTPDGRTVYGQFLTYDLLLQALIARVQHEREQLRADG